VADVANKKMTTNIVRFETTNGNGDIFEIDLVNVCRAKLPISGIWNGYNVVNEQIGIGDGITTDFDLPKNYAKDEGLSIKINGVSVLNYLKELYLSRIGYKLNYSFGGAANAFSPEGDYFASYTTYNANIPIYKRNGESFAVIATVNISGSSEVKGLALSPNAEYFAACDYNARIQVFKRSGNTFTKIVDNAPSINGNGYACAFSPDGIYLAIGDTSSPYLTIFKRTGDIFTKLPNPTTSPSGTVQHIAFSPDGIYLAVGHDYSPYVTIYKRDGDIFTKLPNPASLPSSYGSHVVFTQDGNYLGVSEWSGETFATVYSRNGDSFTKITSSKPLIFTGLSANSVALPLSIDYIASGNGIYNLTKNKTKIKFDTPPIAGDVISADYSIDYMPKDINHVIDVSFSIQFGEGA
jgi:WD40 repeat protein